METLKIKKVRENASVPFRATKGSAGMDLYACIEQEITLEPQQSFSFPTGIAIALPSENYVALVYARSGLSTKFGIAPRNCVGVIDSDYRGEISVCLVNLSDKAYTVAPNDRIAQLVITPVSVMPVELTEELPETKRGAGGFGSTGL